MRATRIDTFFLTGAGDRGSTRATRIRFALFVLAGCGVARTETASPSVVRLEYRLFSGRADTSVTLRYDVGTSRMLGEIHQNALHGGFILEVDEVAPADAFGSLGERIGGLRGRARACEPILDGGAEWITAIFADGLHLRLGRKGAASARCVDLSQSEVASLYAPFRGFVDNAKEQHLRQSR